MHESLPVDSCPFSWAAEDRLVGIRRQVSDGRLGQACWPSAREPLSAGRALELLADIPPADLLVVCHGDSCAPNTLLTGDGRIRQRTRELLAVNQQTAARFGHQATVSKLLSLTPELGLSRGLEAIWVRKALYQNAFRLK